MRMPSFATVLPCAARIGGRRPAVVGALIAGAVAIAVSHPASARTAPNFAGRLVRGPDATPWRASGEISREAVPGLESAKMATDTHPSSRATSATAFFNVSLPAGAVQIDSTYYDLQDFGSLGTRIVAAADGRVHLIFEKDFCELDPGGCPPDPDQPRVFPRAVGYAVRGTEDRKSVV